MIKKIIAYCFVGLVIIAILFGFVYLVATIWGAASQISFKRLYEIFLIVCGTLIAGAIIGIAWHWAWEQIEKKEKLK